MYYIKTKTKINFWEGFFAAFFASRSKLSSFCLHLIFFFFFFFWSELLLPKLYGGRELFFFTQREELLFAGEGKNVIDDGGVFFFGLFTFFLSFVHFLSLGQ